jgi:hypothetical protein
VKLVLIPFGLLAAVVLIAEAPVLFAIWKGGK